MRITYLKRTYTELSGVLNKLIEQGVVKKTETQQPSAATATRPTAQTPLTTTTSADVSVIEPLRLS